MEKDRSSYTHTDIKVEPRGLPRLLFYIYERVSYERRNEMVLFKWRGNIYIGFDNGYVYLLRKAD